MVVRGLGAAGSAGKASSPDAGRREFPPLAPPTAVAVVRAAGRGALLVAALAEDEVPPIHEGGAALRDALLFPPALGSAGKAAEEVVAGGRPARVTVVGVDDPTHVAPGTAGAGPLPLAKGAEEP